MGAEGEAILLADFVATISGIDDEGSPFGGGDSRRLSVVARRPPGAGRERFKLNAISACPRTGSLH